MKSLKFITAVSAALTIGLASVNSYAQDAETPPARVIDFATSESADDHVLGSETAAITLIIWASVTCPHCSEWFTNEWPTVKTDLIETGKLRVVFREFPTAPAELAMTGFRIASCAPEEDYWSIIEYQMENQKEIFDAAREGKGQEIYTKIAKMAGMETDAAIATCFSNPDITAHIIDNANRAQAAKIKGVPAFLINGETYTGKQDAKSLIDLITEMDEKGLSALPKRKQSSKADSDHD